MAKFAASNPISWSLFYHLQSMYKSGVETLIDKQPFRRVKLNGFCPYSLSAFPLAVAAWEAFLNENCMSIAIESDYPDNVLWDIREQAEKWDNKQKAYLVPKLLLGQTFDKGSQPYQDFALLVEIRNDIVHFRLEDAPTRALKDLAQRKITLVPPDKTQYSWPLQLQSTEVIRWSINTIAKMVQTLTRFFPEGQWPGTSLAFNEISESQARETFIKAHIDPDIVESDITES